MAEKTSKTQTGKAEENKQRHENPPVWEWIIAGTGAILVVGAIGFMLYQAVARKTSPPDFSFKVNSITPVTNGYLGQDLSFEVENAGDETAADVNVEGELKKRRGNH